MLLDKGGDIEAQSERTKDTPLSLACSGGRQEVDTYLFNKFLRSPLLTFLFFFVLIIQLSLFLIRLLSYFCFGEPIRNTAMFPTTLLSVWLLLGVT